MSKLVRMRLLVFFVFLFIAVMAGIARFLTGISNPSPWLDAAFLGFSILSLIMAIGLLSGQFLASAEHHRAQESAREAEAKRQRAQHQKKR